MEIVHNGEWDGLPIWRERTAREKLLQALEEQEKQKHEHAQQNPTTIKSTKVTS